MANPTPHIDKARETGNARPKKVPLIMQMEALECGAACLAMILATYGKWIPLEEVRAACGVSRDGSKAGNVVRAARTYGLEAKGFRMQAERLAENMNYPCIVHWNYNHFVVLRGFRNGKAYLADPGGGLRTVTTDEFNRSYTGVVLAFAPSDTFVKSGKPKSVMSFVRKRMKGAVGALIFAIIMSLVGSAASVMSPLFSALFINKVLGSNAPHPEWMGLLAAVMAGFTIVTFLATSLSTFQSTRVSTSFSATSSSSFIWHVLHLPMEFFAQRRPADISARMSMNESVSQSLIQTFAPLLLSVVSAVVYLVMMIHYNFSLAFIGICSVALNLALAQIVSRRRINMTRAYMRDAAMLASTTATGMQMIETIKATGSEEGFFARWAGWQAKSSNAQTMIQRRMAFISVVPSIITSLSDVLVMIIGITLVREGLFTVGAIFAFQALLSQFMGPSSQIISAGQTIMEMRTQMERIDDVMEYPAESQFAPEDDEEAAAYEEPLTGAIHMESLSFGYSRLEKPLLHDFDLDIAPGEQVAIVGPSGCGKSTIAKLLMGLYQPWSGKITYDDRPLNKIRNDVFFASAAMVDQESVIFTDTIANNIRMWDNTISDEVVMQAAKDAHIHDVIMDRPDAYLDRLKENGSDLSGGERQRLELARVLAQTPSIIVLDEATSALDVQTERDVMDSLKQRGATVIMIAHRLSTVRQADKIVVLDKGTIAECGTHEELVAQDGIYAALVRDE